MTCAKCGKKFSRLRKVALRAIDWNNHVIRAWCGDCAPEKPE